MFQEPGSFFEHRFNLNDTVENVKMSFVMNIFFICTKHPMFGHDSAPYSIL